MVFFQILQNSSNSLLDFLTQAIQFAPFSENLLSIDLPIPLLDPVIIAVLPLAYYFTLGLNVLIEVFFWKILSASTGLKIEAPGVELKFLINPGFHQLNIYHYDF